MDIVDEHAFLQWKEDVNETYPGKGKALFQVIYLILEKILSKNDRGKSKQKSRGNPDPCSV